jgi:hypothetical protein
MYMYYIQRALHQLILRLFKDYLTKCEETALTPRNPVSETQSYADVARNESIFPPH